LNLLKRIHDKEAPVRLQAVYGLGRLAAEVDDDEQNEDSDSDNESGHGVLVKLLDILQNDPAAEVRRNLLLNLPLTKEVLPYLLERARDLDGATRRALYARLLPALGDFRHLSLTHREKLLRWGLRDRDEKVREATARLFRERWIEDCAALPADAAEDEEGAQPKQDNQAADPSLDALLELLERIDIINSGGENGIAQIAMKQFWQGRPDYVDYVSFPDSFWDDLTPELAFVARTFNDFCRTSGKEDGYTGPRALDVLVEEKLPEVTKFGFLLERELNKLIETIREAATEEDEEADEDSVQREFIVEQMLHMAQTFDYSDEVGRRKMFSLMREALALPELPEESTRMVVEVLRLVCGEDAKGEREFCGIVLEAVAEVHDTIMGDEDEEPDSTEDSFHSATSQFDGEDGTPQQKKKKSKKAGREDDEDDEEADEDKAIREIMVNMKCLHIAQCMLQNVQCDLEENVHLVTMLNNLVVPAVRSQEAPIRERGLVCLGLCCVLGKVCSHPPRFLLYISY
jgi:condensin complex subunit 3